MTNRFVLQRFPVLAVQSTDSKKHRVGTRVHDHRSARMPRTLCHPREEQPRKEDQEAMRCRNRGEMDHSEERGAEHVGGTKRNAEDLTCRWPAATQPDEHPSTEQRLLRERDHKELVKQVPEHPKQAATRPKARAVWAQICGQPGDPNAHKPSVEGSAIELAEIEAICCGMGQQTLSTWLQNRRFAASAGTGREDGDGAIEAVAELQGAAVFTDANGSGDRRRAAVVGGVCRQQRAQRQATLPPKRTGDDVIAGDKCGQQKRHDDEPRPQRAQRRSRAKAMQVANEPTTAIDQWPSEKCQGDQRAGIASERRPECRELREKGDPQTQRQGRDDRVTNCAPIKRRDDGFGRPRLDAVRRVGVVQGCASTRASCSSCA